MSILQHRSDNPRRVPDWRWQRAGELIEGARVARGRDDDGVRQATKFRRLLARCQTDEDRLVALDACPALYEAHSLYAAEDDAPEPRWELEARLLAREPFPTIERKMGLSTETIAAFECFFFDVINRLDAPSLIVHTVIGRSVQTGLAERDYDALWKLMGYLAGPLVLDSCIYKFAQPQQIITTDGVKAFWKDFAKDQLGMKAGVAALTYPVNWQTREQILTFYTQILQMEANAGQIGGTSETYVSNVKAMMETFAWSKYLPGVDTEMTGKVAELEANGVRLRATELAMIGIGETPTGLEHLISSARFPKEKDKK
jgi:hypothetical protein